MSNPDSLQAICAELRELIVRVMRVERDHAVEVFYAADGQSSPKTRAEFRAAWDALYAGFNRLERLDAEMRKEHDELEEWRVTFGEPHWSPEYTSEQLNVAIEKIKSENAELRARLAACEKDAARYRWIRLRLQVRKERSMASRGLAGSERDAFDIRIGHSFVDSKTIPGEGYTDPARYVAECERVDAAIDRGLAATPTAHPDVPGGTG